MMARMRTQSQAFEWLKSHDPDTALTKTALRRLIITGAVPSVRVGQKYLISLEALEDYLYGANTALEPVPTHHGIREVVQ